MTRLFLEWLYIDAPHRIVNTSKQLCLALYHYFSINLLFQTLVEPWRHDARSFTGAPLRMWGEIIINNIVSRVIGFFLRSFVIAAGITAIITTLLGTVLLILSWYGLPILSLLSIIYGFGLIGGSYV